MNRKPRKNDTDWGNEVAHSVGLIGKVFGKIFSYILNILLTIVLIGLVTGTIVGGALAIYIKNYVDPSLDEFEFMTSSQNMTTKIYYMNFSDRINRIGVPVELVEQRIYGEQNRIGASYSEIPKYLTDAFVAVEDKRFWEHGGVDWQRSISATINWVLGGSTRFGGSTLTQQLIKNVTKDDDNTPQRKIQEMLRALELEKQKDKTEILELYLNMIFLSQRTYGVKAAAYVYFGKDISDLTLIECTAIAAIPQYPTRYDPYLYPENNQERRDSILTLMLDQELITQQEFNLAYGKELKLNMQTIEQQATATNSWYKDAVINEAIELLMEKFSIPRDIASKMVNEQGLQIYTVQDPYIQNTLEEIYLDDIRLLGSDNLISGLIEPESAVVVIDPYTGDILGLVGGRGEKTASRIFNYATQGQRPAGSSIKPISVYAPAIENNIITYGSAVDDVPYDFGKEPNTNPKPWPPNYSGRYLGVTPLNYAVKHSLNTIAVHVLEKLTPQKSFDFLTQQLGLSLVASREIAGGKSVTDIAPAPLALGELSYGISVEEITAAYAIFVNKGVYNKPRTILKILDSEGNVIIDNSGTGKVVISEATATIMTKLLQGVVQDGTGTRVTLRNTIDTAGKTGTTNADNDRWFVGYTPYYVAGVWFGYQTPRSLTGVTTSISSIIWNNIMTELHQKIIADSKESGTPLKKFVDASNVITKEYCIDSGMSPSAACRTMDLRGNRVQTGYFTHATAPAQICNVHVIVDYDMTTGSLASENCPETTKVALIRVESRSFPMWLTVEDAEYTYRVVPEGVPYSMVSNEPFYMNIMSKGKYPGRSGTDEPKNRYCAVHHSDEPIPPVDEPEDEPIEEEFEENNTINHSNDQTNETTNDTTNETTDDTTNDNTENNPDEDTESGEPPGYIW